MPLEGADATFTTGSVGGGAFSPPRSTATSGVAGETEALVGGTVIGFSVGLVVTGARVGDRVGLSEGDAVGVTVGLPVGRGVVGDELGD